MPGGEVGGHDRGRPAGGGAAWRPAATRSTRPRRGARLPRSRTGVDDDAALALLIQGLTAWHLFRTCALAPGESVVVHSGAGGVGSLAVQLAKPLGAGRVIATASLEEKRGSRSRWGPMRPSTRRSTTYAALVEANGGSGVDVVLEMAGGRMFEQSLAALAPFGRMVAYGISTREKVEVRTRPADDEPRVIGFWLMHCLERRDMIDEPLADLFERAARGELEPQVGRDLSDERRRRAHEDLAAAAHHRQAVLDPS